MAIVKVIEVLAESKVSWEDATKEAVKEAGKTVNNITQIYVRNLKAVVDTDGSLTFRLNAKISFVVEA